MRSASRNFKLRYPELHSVRKSAPIGEGNKCGFTLAEVLITLVIIGVIAAITVPTMMNSKNNEELRAGLLKAQSTLAGALEMYYIKNGERLLPDHSGEHSLKKNLLPYIASANDCGGPEFPSSMSVSNCYKNTGKEIPYRSFNKNTLSVSYLDDGHFIMNDGMTVLIENYVGPVYISVDVNGYKKGPNLAGHDLFMFHLTEKGELKPMGAKGTSFYSETDEYCSTTSNSSENGFGCTAKALADPNYFKNLH